jgi:hypothetical protein
MRIDWLSKDGFRDGIFGYPDFWKSNSDTWMSFYYFYYPNNFYRPCIINLVCPDYTRIIGISPMGIEPKMQVPKSTSQTQTCLVGCDWLSMFNKNPVYPDNTHPYSWFKVSTGSFAPKGNEVLDFKNASHLHRN